MGRDTPSPTDQGVWGSILSSPSGVRSGAEPRPKTNLVHFVAARRTLIGIICLISVSSNTAVVSALTICFECCKKGEWGWVSHSPTNQVVWRSVTSSPSGVWGGAPAENEFGAFCGRQKDADSNYLLNICFIKHCSSLAFHLERLQKFLYGVLPFQKVPVWRSGAFRLSLSIDCYHFTWQCGSAVR